MIKNYFTGFVLVCLTALTACQRSGDSSGRGATDIPEFVDTMKGQFVADAEPSVSEVEAAAATDGKAKDSKEKSTNSDSKKDKAVSKPKVDPSTEFYSGGSFCLSSNSQQYDPRITVGHRTVISYESLSEKWGYYRSVDEEVVSSVSPTTLNYVERNLESSHPNPKTPKNFVCNLDKYGTSICQNPESNHAASGGDTVVSSMPEYSMVFTQTSEDFSKSVTQLGTFTTQTGKKFKAIYRSSTGVGEVTTDGVSQPVQYKMTSVHVKGFVAKEGGDGKCQPFHQAFIFSSAFNKEGRVLTGYKVEVLD